MNFQSLNVEDVLKKLNTNLKTGLSLNEVKKRQEIYGKNKMIQINKKNFLQKILEQFSDFMVITLTIASGISFITSFLNKNNDYIDSIIILLIVLINTVIGIVQENNAEKAIESLKKISESCAKVIRNSCEQKINSEDLVPGDILILEAGDKIPSDARLIKTEKLLVEESILTGESMHVSKNEFGIFDQKAQISEIFNMVFLASFITNGRAIAVVSQTGMNTQIGKIAKLIDEGKAPQTPLQKKLANTGKILSIWTFIICGIIFILGLIQNVDPLEMFMISISLAVAAIPEGLPFVITLAISSGVKVMAKKNAIVRKAASVETLGSANIICTDKTGTLTQNKMTVTQIRDSSGKIKLDLLNSKIVEYAILCNNSKQKSSKIIGEATENSLLELAIKIGKNKSELEIKMPRIDEIPFDSSRKIMTTIHDFDKGIKVITKGAPDVLLNICKNHRINEKILKLDEITKKNIKETYESMAKDSLRVLAIAYKDLKNKENKNFESDLIFLGLIGIMDPPKPNVKDAVRCCLEAGIRPVMVTGDHELTARAIAKKVGILNENSNFITGKELNNLSQKELESKIFSYSVFARVSPEHKVRIVKAFQKRGSVVIMTGDGVNDGPALKVSDIGFAMGITGTDVAKAAADIVLTDDNFSSIVEAIRQGRGIYDNIRKTVHFLLSTNIGEIIVVLLAFLIRLPIPLYAIQLLWINFVTDSFPALALGMEKIEENVMKRNPVNPNENLLSGGMGYNIIIEGCFIGTMAILTFVIGKVFFDKNDIDPIIGRTMSFVSLGLSQLAHAFNVRSKKSIFEIGIFGNYKLILATFLCIFLQVIVTILPCFNYLFKTTSLNIVQWIIVIIMTFTPMLISEFEKYFYKNLENNKKFFLNKSLIKNTVIKDLNL